MIQKDIVCEMRYELNEDLSIPDRCNYDDISGKVKNCIDCHNLKEIDMNTDIKIESLNPVIKAMKFAVNRYLYDYANSEEEYKNIIHESLIRARYLLDKMEIYGVDVYGKNYSEWRDDVDNKPHVIFMSDEEMKEWNKCARLAKVLKENNIL